MTTVQAGDTFTILVIPLAPHALRTFFSVKMRPENMGELVPARTNYHSSEKPSLLQTPAPSQLLCPSPHSPLEAVKSMATVKLIWVLEEEEQQGSHLDREKSSLHPSPTACWTRGLGEVAHLLPVLENGDSHASHGLPTNDCCEPKRKAVSEAL